MRLGGPALFVVVIDALAISTGAPLRSGGLSLVQKRKVGLGSNVNSELRAVCSMSLESLGDSGQGDFYEVVWGCFCVKKCVEMC